MESTHWVLEGINQWSQLIGKWNWYTFTLIQIEFEKENMVYGYEFIFIVLGLGFRIRYNTDKSLEQFEEWNDEAKELATDEDLIEMYSDTWTALKDK